MTSRRRLLAACVLVAPLLASSAAWADPVPYVTDKQVDLSVLLPPPIQPGSPEDQAEQQQILALQKSATPARIQQAQADVTETVYAMFTPVLGPKFSPEKLGAADLFFGRVTESEDPTTDPAKVFFKRVRPFLANPQIKALVTPSKSGAYPSGHTTRVTMCAIILADMLPEKKDLIWQRAAEYQLSRVIGGMHYPNDLAGGRLAGTAMAAVMYADSAFRADFAAAKPLVRAALGM
jgi:acid phosphatase (class A)